MAHYMAINKSGKNLPIFSGWPSVDKGNQIGTTFVNSHIMSHKFILLIFGTTFL